MNLNNINKNKTKFFKKEVNDAFFKVKLPSNKKFVYFSGTFFALVTFYFMYPLKDNYESRYELD